MSPAQTRLAAAMWCLWQRQRKRFDQRFNRALVNLIQTTTPARFPPPPITKLLQRFCGDSSCEEGALCTNVSVNGASTEPYAGDAHAQHGTLPANSADSSSEPDGSTLSRESGSSVSQQGSAARTQPVLGKVVSEKIAPGSSAASIAGTESHSEACADASMPEVTALFALMSSERSQAEDDAFDEEQEEEHTRDMHTSSCRAQSCPNCGYKGMHAEPSQFGVCMSGWMYSRAQKAFMAMFKVQDDVGGWTADFHGALSAPGRIFSSRQLLTTSPHNLQFGTSIADLLKVCEASAAELRRQEVMGPFVW